MVKWDILHAALYNFNWIPGTCWNTDESQDSCESARWDSVNALLHGAIIDWTRDEIINCYLLEWIHLKMEYTVAEAVPITQGDGDQRPYYLCALRWNAHSHG